MGLPGFLCIGAQKAGTTWLFAQIQRHPAVWLPPVKELHFFDHLFVPENRAWTEWHVRTGAARSLEHHLANARQPDWGFVRYLADFAARDLFTEDWYRRAFDRPAAAGRLLGDITPEYSTIPEEGIAHLRRLLGAPRVIYMIRDPLSRALSQLKMNVSRHGAPTDAAGWERAATAWDIANRGDYRAYVPRWRRRFADADLLFLPYGRLRTDPEGVMAAVERFLGLDPARYPQAREAVHRGGDVAVPAAVREILTERTAPQRAFLEAEFGADFAAETGA